MRKFILGFSTLVLATSANAADIYNFKVLGFSKDNSTVAFADTVVQDGSGHGVAIVTVVNVAKNSVIAKVEGRDEDENGDEAGTERQALKLALRKLDLSKYGITLGKNTGTTLLDRVPTDLSEDATFSDNVYAGWATPYVNKLQLKLDTKSVGAIKSCYDNGEARKMKLSLIDAQNNKTTVLQEDSSVPTSRGCPLAYRVSKVVRSGSALLVAVEYSSPGFEGPDSSHIIVTSANAGLSN